MPDVVGKTYKDAVVKLVNAGFEAGDPAPDDLDAKVARADAEGRDARGRAAARSSCASPTREPTATPTHRRVASPRARGRQRWPPPQAALAEAGPEDPASRSVIDVEPAGTVLAGEPEEGRRSRPGAWSS